MPTTLRLTHPTPSLVIGLEKPFIVNLEGESLHTRSIIVPAGLEVEIQFGDSTFGSFMLDRLNSDYAYFQQNMQPFKSGIHHSFIMEQAFADILRDAYQYEYSLDRVFDSLISNIPESDFGEVSENIDKRVIQIVNYIREDPFDNTPLSQLAENVNLSASRLAALFSDQVGVPIRKYRLWRRLFSIAENMSTNNVDLTRAANEAGFSDSSHLCRTFKAMVGVSPRQIFSKNTKLILK